MSVPIVDPSHLVLRQGRYVVLEQLGEGTQGTTWTAADRREGRTVAIKRFDVRGARAWKDVELAEREAHVLAGLSHPNLPRYIEHFEEQGALYLVMEKIEGQPLSELRARGPMPEREVTRLLRDADDVLTYLHGKSPPVIHRDIKPANVIRRSDGSFAFVDFGAVCDRLRPNGSSTVVGTFGYMAPEQFQGRAGPAADVYAIGATAIAMLTGEEPERLARHGLAIDVDAALAGRGPCRLRGPLRRMLEIDPDTRPTRIGPLLDGAGGPDLAPDFDREIEVRIRERVEREVQKRSKRSWLLPLALLIVGLAVVLKPGALVGLVVSGFLFAFLGVLIVPLLVVALVVHWVARAANRAKRTAAAYASHASSDLARYLPRRLADSEDGRRRRRRPRARVEAAQDGPEGEEYAETGDDALREGRPRGR